MEGYGVFAGLFAIAFITWQGFTAYADRFDTDDLVFRAVVLLGMVSAAREPADAAAGD